MKKDLMCWIRKKLECIKKCDLKELEKTEFEILIDTLSEEEFLDYIETLNEEDLNKNMGVVLKKIASYYKNHKENGLVCLDRLVMVIKMAELKDQRDQANNHECQECRKNSDLEKLEGAKPEDLFYFIDTLREEDLEMNFQILLDKIAADHLDNEPEKPTQRAIVCFDRLITKMGKKIDFKHEEIKQFLEKYQDFRFKLAMIFNPDVNQETLIQFLHDEDADVKKSTQERLKRDFGFVDSNFETSHAKDILYLAKQMALEEQSETISLEHIKKSAVNFNIINQEFIKLLDDFSKYEKSESIREKINKAKEEKMIKYDDDCKKSELLSWLLTNSTSIIFKG